MENNKSDSTNNYQEDKMLKTNVLRSTPSDKDISTILIASGDSRLSANQDCWPAQAEMEKKLTLAFQNEGVHIVRGHPYDPIEKHGFISSQRMGMDVFKSIDPYSRIIVAESVWQYSYHVLPGLHDHKGPILTVANWDGLWPGLVGLLNLNASLTKMNVPYSTIWSKDFTDPFFVKGIQQWIHEGKIDHDLSHVREFNINSVQKVEYEAAEKLHKELKIKKAILGIFDEGCMGMANAIIEDNLLNPLGIYKERLSQSALVAEMRLVTDEESDAVKNWLDKRGMRFDLGKDEAKDLTSNQINEQLKMYIAAARMAAKFGCDAIGIQYQQGLKDMVAASDLAEGLLNNVERPPVYCDGQELFSGQAIPHFNEVDECAGVDALITNKVWNYLKLDPATTLHDIRWGEHYNVDDENKFVWVFMISGAIPASHIKGGYKGAISMRQPPMFFPRGGGTLKGVSKPGEFVWSRIFIESNQLHVDIGRGIAVDLPDEEVQRRLNATNPEWPIMNAVLHGITRDQMMARHKANHIQVVYAPSSELADKALAIKATMMSLMGIHVHLCGDVKVG
jgi:L-fucose isomerase-like protein